MKKRMWFVFPLIVSFFLSTVLGGCQNTENSANPSDVTLLDPLDDTGGFEVAARRTLTDAKVYFANVVPYVAEYSFPKDVKFSKYLTYPGTAVKKGTVLAKADTTDLENNIEAKEKQIRSLEESYEEYRKETQESLSDPKEEERRLADIMDNLNEEKPEEYLPLAAGETQRQKNPAYDEWSATYVYWEEKYRVQAHNNYMKETELEQRRLTYELDHEYALKQLENLKKELKNLTLKSGMDGTVMAVKELEAGNYVSEKNTVIAVGDTSRKVVKSDYINKTVIARAKEVYAIIGGKRYETEYQAMDADEYARLSAQNNKVFSTFYLKGDEEELSAVQAGDYAVIVVVNKAAENVVSVPKETVYEGELGSFVYVRKGDETVAVDVKTGMSDGVYTEILSGVEEGDKILLKEGLTHSNTKIKLATGEFHADFKGDGYLTYPSVSKATNPVKYGTVYFTEFTVELYQHVEKGDVIAKIRVEKDEVALQRQQLKLQRLNERLQPYLKDEETRENNKKLIEARQKEIEDTQKTIDEMTADYRTTLIRAPKEGIVVSMRDCKAEDILWPNYEFLEIADESTCFVLLENKNQLLQYGNEVTVSFNNTQGEPASAVGKVVSLSNAGVSSDLKSDNVMIQMPTEVIGQMAADVEEFFGWRRRNTFAVEGKIRKMDQVILVPRTAVWEKEGQTYVFVVEKDGTVTARSFLAGGYDTENYWAAAGLSEGMELCLK